MGGDGMIALIVTFLFGIIGFGLGAEGQWGPCAICVVIIIFAWIMHSAAVEDTKAWSNRQSYWAMDGKDRAKARHKWEREAREEEAREAAEREEAERLRRERIRERAMKKAAKRGYESDAAYERRRDGEISSYAGSQPEPMARDVSPEEYAEARRKREAWMAEQRAKREASAREPEVSDWYMKRSAMIDIMRTNNERVREEVFDCPECGRRVRTAGKPVYEAGQQMYECRCPVCCATVRIVA